MINIYHPGEMRAANPEGWAQLHADANLIGENREAIKACRAALARSGKAQRCSVTLAAAPTPSPRPSQN
jgi:hypothetical protein